MSSYTEAQQEGVGVPDKQGDPWDGENTHNLAA